jgi:preprotein translocase subunit SecA
VITKLLSKLIGDPNEKEINRIRLIVAKINDIEQGLQALSEEELKAKTGELKARLTSGETVDDLLPEAFAVVKNACRRLVGTKFKIGKLDLDWVEIPYDVQLIGGIVLHEGKIAEMKTGEGKTLVASLPVYLNALTEQGVHVITVNDYLAQRDAEWMGMVYKYLGLSVGCIVHGLTNEDRRAAYACDITYGTNNEFGFDYLRDNMVNRLEDCVQRGLNYAIVDEVDSILIDEARTPLIISSPSEESTGKYLQYSQLVQQLKLGTHYEIDEKMKTAILTEEGIKKMEELLGVTNIYTESGFITVHHLEQALKSHALFKRDIDYVVKDEEIIIVDEFTGRLMPGRRYSDGLHQAIEAKERVEVKRESKTLATITFQNYFRLYNKLAGMTGTAVTEAEEFAKIYKLETLVIPTNVLVARNDKPDAIYKSEQGKYAALAKIVKEKYARGQPCLIGTISIEKSEVLSELLKKNIIPHNVLNAKQHEREAEIVAQAGQKGAITIATNMAGRGTDIKLGAGVKDLGGLAILGTERHEARRIDNQLRGRSGRQGDAGESQFFISMEDSLMRLFGSDRVRGMMDFLNMPEDMPIENKIISKSIEGAQKKVEGHHFDIRKHLVEYDDVMNKHREIIYKKRRKILEWDFVAQTNLNIEINNDKTDSINVKQEILSLIQKLVENIVDNHTNGRQPEEWEFENILKDIQAIHSSINTPITIETLQGFYEPDQLIDYLNQYLIDEYQKKEDSLPDPSFLRRAERAVYLRTIDVLWMEHIDAMSHLREGVALRGYGQRDPLIEYKGEAFQMFKTLLFSIEKNTINTLFKINIQVQAAPVIRAAPSQILRTNEAEIEEALMKSDISPAPQVIKADQPQKIISHSVGRNDPCACGSGKKYKKCCGRFN